MSAANPKSKRLPPLSIRVTAAEKAQIKRNAGNTPISAYAKKRLLKADTRNVVMQKDVAQILAKLGQSGYAPNFAIMANATRHGALMATDDVAASILQACDDIAAIKSMLMRFLRIKEH